jgi:hypothetical protein
MRFVEIEVYVSPILISIKFPNPEVIVCVVCRPRLVRKQYSASRGTSVLYKLRKRINRHWNKWNGSAKISVE